MKRRSLSWIASLAALLVLLAVSALMFALPTFAVPATGQSDAPLNAQPSTPIPLIQTLNARMSERFGSDGTPIPQPGSLEALIADLPKSRTEDGAFVLGNPDAPYTMVLFTDYLCPHCQDYYPTVQEFIRTHVSTGDAALEVRIYPTAGGATTFFLSQVSDCIDTEQPGSFWTIFTTLFGMRLNRTASEGVARDLAAMFDINYTDILVCSGESLRPTLDVEMGQQVGIASTPSVLMRFGDAEPTFIEFEGVTYNRGPVPLNVLDAVLRGTDA